MDGERGLLGDGTLAFLRLLETVRLVRFVAPVSGERDLLLLRLSWRELFGRLLALLLSSAGEVLLCLLLLRTRAILEPQVFFLRGFRVSLVGFGVPRRK